MTLEHQSVGLDFRLRRLTKVESTGCIGRSVDVLSARIAQVRSLRVDDRTGLLEWRVVNNSTAVRKVSKPFQK